MNIVRLAAFAVSLLSLTPFASAAGEGWRSFRTDEGGRTVCYAQADAGPVVVGFFAEAGQPVQAFIGGLVLPSGIEMGFQVFGKQARYLVGDFGPVHVGHVFPGISGEFLDEVVDGTVLTVADARAGGFAVMLAGSSAAIADLRSCAMETSSVAPITAQSPVTSPSFTTLPAPGAVIAAPVAAPEPVAPVTRRAVVRPGAAYLPDRQLSLMPQLEAAIELVATTHPGCVSIDNASSSPSRSTPSQWVFFVSCEMEGHLLPFQNVFVRNGVIYDTSR